MPFHPEGVFQVKAFDRRRRLLGGQQLVFYGDRITARITTDEHGAIVFLGNPTMYHIDIGPELGIAIEPL